MHRHALTEAQWARLLPLLPRQVSGPKVTRGDRLFIEAVLFRAKTGLPWRDLPERFGPWKSVYNRFSNWARRGTGRRSSVSFSWRSMRPDQSSMVPSFAHTRMRRAEKGAPMQCSGPRGGFSTKLHVVVDTKARPIYIALTPGPSARDDVRGRPIGARPWESSHRRYRIRLERLPGGGASERHEASIRCGFERNRRRNLKNARAE